MPAARATGYGNAELGLLGSGRSDDRLSFRLVLKILWRCVPLLRAVQWHLAVFSGCVVLLGVLAITVGAIGFDALWTRVLQGEPMSELQAAILRLDANAAVHVERLSDAVRMSARNRMVVASLAGALVIGPAVAALFYQLTWILQRINQTLREQLVERVQTLSLRFHADSRVGDAVYRVYQDSAMVTDLIRTLFLGPAWYLLRFLVAVAVVSFFDPTLALVLALSWPPALLLGAWFSRRLRVGFRGAREANSALTSRILETLAGIKVIKAFGAERREQERFERASLHAFGQAHRARSLYAVFGVLLFWVAGTALLVVTASGALHAETENPLFGKRALIAFGFAAWNLGLFNFFKVRAGDGSAAVELVFRLWARAQDIGIGLDRVFELLDLEPEVEDAPDAIEMPPFRSSIAFRGVSFAYAPDRPVLEKADLDATPGTITAIVGPTGSGKSTLMALLLRLFDPDDGRIEIDGVDLRRFTLKSLRGNIAIALQENLLFGTTVAENIRYAVPTASDAAIREVARLVCADEFIRVLPEGYDTLLGERGTKLSTGQRQRLSIARALLKDAPILILDEPTASLDAETELRLMDNLAQWGASRAIFLITHRLSTIRRAHRIAVVEGGRVAESGTHAELMQRADGVYRRLVGREALDASDGAPAERP